MIDDLVPRRATAEEIAIMHDLAEDPDWDGILAIDDEIAAIEEYEALIIEEARTAIFERFDSIRSYEGVEPDYSDIPW